MNRLGLTISVLGLMMGSCRSGAQEFPQSEARLGSVAVGSKHAYYQRLADRKDALWSLSLRSQEETNLHTHGKPPALDVVYSAASDASEIRLGSGRGSIRQIRRKFRRVDSGQLLVTWDFWLNPDWASQRQAIRTHKAWMLGQTGRGDTRRLESRLHYHFSPNRIDTRTYLVGGQRGNLGRLEPINETAIVPGRLTRVWILVDFDAKTYSKWVADNKRGPIAVYDQAPIPHLTSLDWFWIEFNSSQSTPDSTERLVGWMCNLVMLASPKIDVSAIVEQPE